MISISSIKPAKRSTSPFLLSDAVANFAYTFVASSGSPPSPAFEMIGKDDAIV